MIGLLDFIFSNLDIESLERKKVLEYLCYLQEITPQVHAMEEKVKLYDYRLRLTERLTYLDRTAFNELKSVLAENRLAIASKKNKYHLV